MLHGRALLLNNCGVMKQDRVYCPHSALETHTLVEHPVKIHAHEHADEQIFVFRTNLFLSGEVVEGGQVKEREGGRVLKKGSANQKGGS
jgi:hypothetical protein